MNNHNLTSLAGVDSFTETSGLTLHNNSRLTNLAGFDALQRVRSLTIVSDAEDIAGFQQLTHIPLLTLTMPNLSEMRDFFPNDTKTLKSIVLYDCRALTSLEGFFPRPIWSRCSLTTAT